MTFAEEIKTITSRFENNEITKRKFLLQLMTVGGKPRQVNKFLPKPLRQDFTDYYIHCTKVWLEHKRMMEQGY